MADIDAKVWLESVMLDEDDMVSDSSSDVCTQQSIKYYVDAAEASAKSYTDSELAALTFATEGYVDAGDANTLSSAQSYADAADATTLSSANSYTDSAVFTHPRDHATSLLNYHDVIINSSVGIEFQTDLWDHVAITPSVTATGALTAPDWVKFTDNGGGSTGLWTLAFSPTSEEEILAQAVFPQSHHHQTDVYPFLLWTAPSTGSAGQVVNWGLEYYWPLTSGTVGNSTVISANTHYPTGTITANQIYTTPLPSITPPVGDELDAMYLRIFRDASGALGTDDYGDDTYFGGLVIRFMVNRHSAPMSEF